MKRLVGLLLVVSLIWVSNVPAFAARVSVGQIVLENQKALTQVEEAIRRSLQSQNLIVSQDDPDYTVNVYHKDTQRTRSFNWVILILPLWPIIGITQSHTTVYVDSTAINRSGQIAWQGSGEAKASTILFSDFVYPSEVPLLSDAAERALRGLGSLAWADLNREFARHTIELKTFATTF